MIRRGGKAEVQQQITSWMTIGANAAIGVRGYAVDVVPATTSAKDVLAKNPDGIFLSNGPGDPAALDYIHGALERAPR